MGAPNAEERTALFPGDKAVHSKLYPSYDEYRKKHPERFDIILMSRHFSTLVQLKPLSWALLRLRPTNKIFYEFIAIDYAASVTNENYITNKVSYVFCSGMSRVTFF